MNILGTTQLHQGIARRPVCRVERPGQSRPCNSKVDKTALDISSLSLHNSLYGRALSDAQAGQDLKHLLALAAVERQVSLAVRGGHLQ